MERLMPSSKYQSKAFGMFLSALACVPISAQAGAFKTWSWSIPSSTTGNFSANESSEPSSLSGTFSRHATNRFIQLTVTASSGASAPPVNTVRFALEAPSSTLFVEPTLQTESKLIMTSASGSCPDGTWSGNFLFVHLNAGSVNMTGFTPAFGRFTWHPSNGTLNLDTVYSLKSYTLLASNVALAGTCANGVITLSGSGDRGGKVFLGGYSGGVYVINTSTNPKVAYSLSGNAIPTMATLNGSYSVYTFDHGTTPTLSPLRATFTSATTRITFDKISNIATNTIDTNNGWKFTGLTINLPHAGMLKGTLVKRVAGVDTTYNTDGEVICTSYLSVKTTLICLAHDNGTNNSDPRGFILVSDAQAFTAGTIDAYSFGTSGIASPTIPTASTNSLPADGFVQSDGKFVGVGATRVGNYPCNSQIALTRILYDGSVDSTFGSGGYTVTGATGCDTPKSITGTPDGKLVAVGSTSTGQFGANEDFFVSQFLSNGSLNTAFGGTGTVVTPVSSGSGIDRAYGVAAQSDGKIVVTGQTAISNGYSLVTVRYAADGNLDWQFGGTGVVTTPFGGTSGNYSTGTAVAVQSDGKIVVAGTGNWDQDLVVARLTNAGVLDSSFSGDGKYNVSLGFSASPVNSVAIQADGKILVAGHVTNAAMGYGALFRLTAGGVLDSSFASSGKLLVTAATFRELAIQTDGKILALGYYYPSYGAAFYRINANGTLDSTFGTSGKASFSFPANHQDSGSNGLAITNDGKVVGAYALTNATTTPSTRMWAIYRLWGN